MAVRGGLTVIIIALLIPEVPVDEAQVTISVRNIKGVKMPEEVEVSKLQSKIQSEMVCI